MQRVLISFAVLTLAGVGLMAQAEELPRVHATFAEPAPTVSWTARKAAPAKDLRAPIRALASKACVQMFTECDSIVSGELTPDDCDLGDGTRIDFWEFQGSAGQTVTVTQRSNEFDSFLFLIDPSLATAATDDDSGGGLDSEIVFVLDQSGPWLIGANGFSTADLGDYTVTLSCSDNGPSGPAAPSNLVATTLSSTEIQLDWRDNSDDENEFRVELRSEGGGFQDIGAVEADIVAAIVSELLPDTAYDFRIRARNGNGNSAYSNVATATTQPADGGMCVAGPTTLCFLDDRFRAEVEWRNHADQTGVGRVVPVDSPDSGIFWFFAPDNWEMMIKMIDACDSPFNSFWLFAASLTDVEYALTVTDTETGESKQYLNTLGMPGPNVLDTQAFFTCP